MLQNISMDTTFGVMAISTEEYLISDSSQDKKRIHAVAATSLICSSVKISATTGLKNDIIVTRFIHVPIFRF